MEVPKVILCADDFAISHSTSRVINQLARSGSINAVSCMAASPYWPTDAKLLEGIEKISCGDLGPVQVGLHLVLATERPLGPLSCLDERGNLPGPDRLLAMALSGQINGIDFEDEIERQFIAFISARGRVPDFVDAHQHVHVYPVLRKLVIAATKRHAPDAWIRVPSDQLLALLKRPFPGKAVGSAVHSFGMRWEILRHGLRANRSFAGHYDFGTEYEKYLPSFFESAANFHVIMCHPGTDEIADDPIAKARTTEAAVLARMPLHDRVARYSAMQS